MSATYLPGPLAAIDVAIRRFISFLQGMTFLFGHAVAGLFRRPFYGREYITHMNELGLASAPVIGLTGLVTGAVLALQASISLEQFGAISMLGNALINTVVRELGPIFAGLLVAGRVGAGITSQIGAMRVTSQIDALTALGTDPVKKLVVPRVVALTIALPLLTIYICLLATVGGWILARLALNFSTHYYWASIIESLRFVDIASGMTKAAVFGFLISMIACYKGLQTEGGTHGVGQATTQTVVTASLSILVANFFLTQLFYTMLS